MPAHDLDTENLYICKKSTPNIYRIFMAFPMEVTEYWECLFEDSRKDVKCGVEPILAATLLNKIKEALLKDELVKEDAYRPLGIKPLKGRIRTDKLSRQEYIQLAVAQSQYIANLSKLYGDEHTSGCQIFNTSIPKDVAIKLKNTLLENANMALNSKKAEPEEQSCDIRMAMLMQINSKE